MPQLQFAQTTTSTNSYGITALLTSECKAAGRDEVDLDLDLK